MGSSSNHPGTAPAIRAGSAASRTASPTSPASSSSLSPVDSAASSGAASMASSTGPGHSARGGRGEGEEEEEERMPSASGNETTTPDPEEESQEEEEEEAASASPVMDEMIMYEEEVVGEDGSTIPSTHSSHDASGHDRKSLWQHAAPPAEEEEDEEEEPEAEDEPRQGADDMDEDVTAPESTLDQGEGGSTAEGQTPTPIGEVAPIPLSRGSAHPSQSPRAANRPSPAAPTFGALVDERELDESMLEARRQSLKIKEAADEASRKLYEIKMEEYKLEEVLIITGKHPEYAQAYKVLEGTKQSRLKQSSDSLRLAVRLAESEYQAASKLASDTYHAAVRSMKASLVEWISQKKYRLMAEYIASVRAADADARHAPLPSGLHKRKPPPPSTLMMDAGYPTWVKRCARARRRAGEPDVIVPPTCRGLSPGEQEEDIMCIRLLCAKQ